MAEISGMLPLEISQTDVQNLNFFWTKKTKKRQNTKKRLLSNLVKIRHEIVKIGPIEMKFMKIVEVVEK